MVRIFNCDVFSFLNNNEFGITEKDLDKWGEVSFTIRRGKEMDIAPIAGVLEVEMRYGKNIMRTRIHR